MKKAKMRGAAKEMNSKTGSEKTLFEPTGLPPWSMTISLALQHLVAMIVGCVTPAIMIANVTGMEQDLRVLLIQSSLVMAAVTTLLQLFPIGNKWIKFGAGLPVIFGVSFAYVPSMQAIAVTENGIAAIMGALAIGGIVATIVGFMVDKIHKFFPPLITGTVVFTIGLSLYPTAINYMAGGTANTYELVVETKGLTEALVYGSWQNWLVAIITLVVVLVLNQKGKGVFKLASILIGMVVGYAVAAAFGMVSFSDVASASMFATPKILPFGMVFDPAACVAIGLLFAINAVQAIGDFTATTIGGMNREPSKEELKGGIIAYGISNTLASFFGGLPMATYSQNVGIVTTNKVINRTVFATTGVFILIAGFSPKFAAILTTIPQCVLGGATLTVFATIAMTGMKLIASQKLTARNTTVVGLSVALGVGITQASASIGQLPESFIMIFGKSPVVIATIVAVFLNIILPKEE